MSRVHRYSFAVAKSIAVAIAVVIAFFPIFWMMITAFKTEQGAYSPDLIFMPTLASFKDVFSRSNYFAFMMNSIYVSIGSTLAEREKSPARDAETPSSLANSSEMRREPSAILNILLLAL